MGQVAQAKHTIKEVRRQFVGTFKQFVLGIDIKGCDPGGTGHRMGGIGIAMEEFRAVRIAGGVKDSRLNFGTGGNGTHGNSAVGQCLGHGDQVRLDCECLGGESRTCSAKTGNHFIKYQQDAVFVANRAKLFEIAFGRHDGANRSGNRFDKDRSNRIAAIGLADFFKIVGQIGIGFRLAAGEFLFFGPCVTHMHDITGNPGKITTVIDHACKRRTAKVHPVIAPCPRYKTGALRIAGRTVIGEAHLHCGINRLGT